MPTRNVVLTDYQQETIDRLVKSGRYQNASEVLREGLRLIEVRDKREKAALEAMRQAVLVGLDDLDAGRYVEFENFDDLRDHLARRGNEAIKRGAARYRV